MSQYERFTRKCTLEQLRPELLHALRDYLAGHGLVDIETQILMCCETRSERQKPDMFASLLGENQEKVYYTGVFVTPQWLVWAQTSDKAGAAVVAAQLREIHVKPFASLWVRDAGLEVSGYVGSPGTQVRGYIGLGTEPAAQEFCEQVKRAVDAVNPPRSLLDMFTAKRR